MVSNWATYSATQILASIASMLNLAGKQLNNKMSMVQSLEAVVLSQLSLEVSILLLFLQMEDAVP